jgi:hypothetical protein
MYLRHLPLLIFSFCSEKSVFQNRWKFSLPHIREPILFQLSLASLTLPYLIIWSIPLYPFLLFFYQFVLLSTVISLLEWSFSLREMMNRFLGFTPATDGCDRLLWSIRVQRICVYCISITGGKWISLRNGFGHEADGGSSEAIIFHDATKSGIWTDDIIFLGTHTIWCWNFKFWQCL